MSEHESTDRYQALQMPYPDPETMCEGQCDGTGVYPIKVEGYSGFASFDGSDEEYSRWEFVHKAAGNHVCDGYHFIACPDCGGTGKR